MIFSFIHLKGENTLWAKNQILITNNLSEVGKLHSKTNKICKAALWIIHLAQHLNCFQSLFKFNKWTIFLIFTAANKLAKNTMPL